MKNCTPVEVYSGEGELLKKAEVPAEYLTANALRDAGTVVDLDGDGQNEFIAGNVVLDKDLNIIAKLVKGDELNPESMEHYPADLDNDGKMEVVTTTYTIEQINPAPERLIISDYQGNRLAEMETANWVSAIAFGDLNNDGFKEIVVSNHYTYPLQIFGL